MTYIESLPLERGPIFDMFEGEVAGRRTSRFEMEPCKLTRPERVEVMEQGA
jgi:hypothetical protein